MDANTQAKELFVKFKALHPNSPEEFDPSIENVIRWNWSVIEAEKRSSVKTEKFGVPDQRSAKALAESRQVRVFDKLPAYVRDKFMEIASRFPGRKVWATGSRIDGTYIDPISGISITRMRQALLKKETKESDYDIIVELLPGEKYQTLRKNIPTWADLVSNPNPDDPKILIPMWDFSKLPVSEFKRVVDLVAAQRWGELMAVHNQYNLSPNFYCCDEGPVKRWFSWAIETGIIYEGTEKDAGSLAE